LLGADSERCLFFAPASEGPWIALAISSICALFFFQRYLRDVAVHFDEAKLVARCDQVLWGFIAATAISGFVIWSQPMEHTVAAMLFLVVAVVADCVLFLFGLDLTLRIASTLESNGTAASSSE
jgi:hypothetical protein